MSAQPHGTTGDPYLTPHASSSALVLIDVQRDFYDDDAPARIEGTAAALPAMTELVNLFRRHGRPIVHVVRLYRRDGSNVDVVRRHAVESGAEIAAPGSEGSQIAPELLPGPVELDPERLLAGQFQAVGPGEHVMYKSRWGAFYDTGLEEYLRAGGIDTVVFAGCNFPNCPRTSIYEASERDFRIVLVSDAISGLYPRGADECRAIGVRLRTVAETAAWIEAGDLGSIDHDPAVSSLLRA
ncbi:cysteine hydrolase family protein [Nocardia sp. NPDC057668]|uniref:cysteine hydrolase family protein n=1 Tax=Nocardia sp. NPDC057668 TaxID=3346202 RepID=UPI00366FB177